MHFIRIFNRIRKMVPMNKSAFLLILFYGIITAYEYDVPNRKCGREFHYVREVIIKSDEVHEHDNCTWEVNYSSYSHFKITVEELELDPATEMVQIDEIVGGASVPKARLTGSLTSSGLMYSSQSASQIRINYLRRGNVTGKPRFHFQIRNIGSWYMDNPCSRPGVWQAKDVQQQVVLSKQDKSCVKIFTAPTDQTIQLIFNGPFDKRQFYLAELQELLDANNTLPTCSTTNLSSNVYRSYTNQVVLRYCANDVNLNISFVAKPSQCSCKNDKKLVQLETMEKFGTSEKYSHFEFCKKLNCTHEIYTEVKENATHRPIFVVNYQSKPRFPGNFHIDMSDLDWQEYNILNYTSVRQGTLSLPASDMTLHIDKGAVHFEVSIHMIPRECVCFGNESKLIQKYSLKNGNITFKFPDYCSPMDCWVKIGNREKLTLDLQLNSNQSFGIEDHLCLSLDEKLERMLPMDGRFLLEDLGKNTSSVESIYLHLQIPAQEDLIIPSNKEDNITYSEIFIEADWINACECYNFSESIDRLGTRYIYTSPNFPDGYCDKLHCSYQFTAPSDARIHVNISILELADDQDVFFMETHNGEKINRTYFHNVTDFITDRNSLLLRFETDNSDVAKGFQIELKVVFDKKISPWLKLLYALIIIFLVLLIIVAVFWKLKQMPQFTDQIFMRYKVDQADGFVVMETN